MPSSVVAGHDPAVPTPSTALLRWQSDLTWSLFSYHLDPAAVRWEPVELV